MQIEESFRSSGLEKKIQNDLRQKIEYSDMYVLQLGDMKLIFDSLNLPTGKNGSLIKKKNV